MVDRVTIVSVWKAFALHYKDAGDSRRGATEKITLKWEITGNHKILPGQSYKMHQRQTGMTSTIPVAHSIVSSLFSVTSVLRPSPHSGMAWVNASISR